MTVRKAQKLSPLVLAAIAIASLGTFSTVGASASATTGKPPIDFKAIGPAKATGKTLSLAKGKAGIFVIASNGHSLYVYANDHGTKSACTGTCATYWPAYTVTGKVTVGTGINKADVGKANGQKPHQLSYYGHLLYYFASDSAPGQTNGTKITGWHLLGPFGNVMLPRT